MPLGPLSLLLTIGLAIGSLCGDGRDFPELEPFEPHVLTQLHEIRDEVSKIRELPINEDVTEGWVAAKTYADYVNERFEEFDEAELEEILVSEAALKLLGLLDPDDTLIEEAREFRSSGWAGFYRRDANELILVGDGGRLSRAEASTIAHEYVHSFQDALVEDWDAFYDEAREESSRTQYGETLRCVVEGDAVLAESLYNDENLWWSLELLANRTFIERSGLWVYAACPFFIEHVYERSGWEGVNALYEKPPITVEQVLHPEKYDSGEGPTGLDPVDLAASLGAEWSSEGAELFGEYDLYSLVIDSASGHHEAMAIAAGWGVAWIDLYHAPVEGEAREVLVHLALQWDSDADYAEFGEIAGLLVERLRHLNPDAAIPALIWHPDELRVDLVVATDEGAAARAADELHAAE